MRQGDVGEGCALARAEDPRRMVEPFVIEFSGPQSRDHTLGNREDGVSSPSEDGDDEVEPMHRGRRAPPRG